MSDPVKTMANHVQQLTALTKRCQSDPKYSTDAIERLQARTQEAKRHLDAVRSHRSAPKAKRSET